MGMLSRWIYIVKQCISHLSIGLMAAVLCFAGSDILKIPVTSFVSLSLMISWQKDRSCLLLAQMTFLFTLSTVHEMPVRQ